MFLVQISLLRIMFNNWFSEKKTDVIPGVYYFYVYFIYIIIVLCLFDINYKGLIHISRLCSLI